MAIEHKGAPNPMTTNLTPSVPPIALAGEPPICDVIDVLFSQKAAWTSELGYAINSSDFRHLLEKTGGIHAPTPSASSVPVAIADPSPGVLTYTEAQQIVSRAKLRKESAYIRPYPAEGKVVIEGKFSPEELEAIAFMLRAKVTEGQDRAVKHASDELTALLGATK